MQVMTQSQI